MKNKITVAIADDHFQMREVIKVVLKKYNHEVIFEAPNGSDLITQIQEGDILPDVCIIDANMPMLNGPATVRKLKETWPGLKIIGFTNDDKKGEEMIENGADAFLLKTCPVPLINKCIIEVIELEKAL